MNEYTVASIVAVVAVVGVELVWFRTGIFATATFWISYAIVVFFQCLVDGWLTKLSAPIVVYGDRYYSGWRAPFDIPVEDFAFGFALVALTIILWEWAGPQGRAGLRRRGGAGAEGNEREETSPTRPR
ncbi:MAG: lycopene cyclase domain-containing protein [Actinomycetota bacterium]|nr:lycopene cyclase domain-containing protein [Actinomycetota bacterium]